MRETGLGCEVQDSNSVDSLIPSSRCLSGGAEFVCILSNFIYKVATY